MNQHDYPRSIITVDPNPCYASWGPGCDSYNSGHACDRDGGHDGRHRCHCGATKKRNRNMTIQVESDGTDSGTVVKVAESGEVLAGVKSVSYRKALGECAQLEIEFGLQEIRTHGGAVTWTGLEHVPTDILRAELAGRDDA